MKKMNLHFKMSDREKHVLSILKEYLMHQKCYFTNLLLDKITVYHLDLDPICDWLVKRRYIYASLVHYIVKKFCTTNDHDWNRVLQNHGIGSKHDTSHYLSNVIINVKSEDFPLNEF